MTASVPAYHSDPPENGALRPSQGSLKCPVSRVVPTVPTLRSPDRSSRSGRFSPDNAYATSLHASGDLMSNLTMSGVDLLTIEQAAERINMSVRYVRRLVAERRIAFHKIGRAVRLHVSDVDAHVAAGRVEPLTVSTVWSGVRGVA
jgi:excisionase family DNA binding protein